MLEGWKSETKFQFIEEENMDDFNDMIIVDTKEETDKK